MQSTFVQQRRSSTTESAIGNYAAGSNIVDSSMASSSTAHTEAPAPTPTVACDCILCLAQPRQVRFNCGHTVTCRDCANGLRFRCARPAWAVTGPASCNNPNCTDERHRAPFCPSCRAHITSWVEETAEQLAERPTYHAERRTGSGTAGAAEAAPGPAEAAPRNQGRGTRRRGGRGRGCVGPMCTSDELWTTTLFGWCTLWLI